MVYKSLTVSASRYCPARGAALDGAGHTPIGALVVQELGFNLHAASVARAEYQPARERLLRYMLRPPLAKERLTLLPDNHVRLKLKRPFRDGTYALEMDVLSRLARLAASVPPPKLHLVRYSGLLAPASPWRPLVIPPLEPSTTQTPPAPQAHTKPPAKPARTGPRCRYWPWAELMRLTLGLPGSAPVVRQLVIREPCIPTVTSMASVPGHAASPSCSIALWPTCF